MSDTPLDPRVIALDASLRPDAPLPTRDEVLAHIENALTEVSALCRGDKRWRMSIPVGITDSDFTISAALILARKLLRAPADAGPPRDTALGLRLARHLFQIQAEDGCDDIGQETNDLAFEVLKHYGLRFTMVEHPPVPACQKVGPHSGGECEHDGIPWGIEPIPGGGV